MQWYLVLSGGQFWGSFAQQGWYVARLRSWLLHAIYQPQQCRGGGGVWAQESENFHQISKYKSITLAQPLHDFYQIFTHSGELRPGSCVKIKGGSLEEFWSYGGFNLRGSVTPKFSVHPSGETSALDPKCFEVQERAQGPLSPCQVWWGSDFARHWGSQKSWVFLPFCPSRSWIAKFERTTLPRNCRNLEVVLILLDRRRFVFVHSHSTCLHAARWCHYRILMLKMW